MMSFCTKSTLIDYGDTEWRGKAAATSLKRNVKVDDRVGVKARWAILPGTTWDVLGTQFVATSA